MSWHWKWSPEKKVAAMKKRWSYGVIAGFYGTRRAERSQVPLIYHIDEGLLIMARAGAKRDEMDAYCLHPLFQNDAELSTVGAALLANQFKHPQEMTGSVMALVFEYRNQANAWLSDKVTLEEVRDWIPTPGCQPDPAYRPLLKGRPTPGPLPGVRMMLIADKVQNRKDFMRYHLGTHERSLELEAYFETWLNALGIDEAEYYRLVEGL